MTYRRDAPVNESIPLPIETVYCSEVDAVLRGRKLVGGNKFDRFGVEHFNRLYFKYPPEWQTSNIGEKIIGIRNMSIHWKDANLQFVLYVRKYKHIIARSKDDDVNQTAIDELDDDTLNDNLNIFHIPINIRITNNDTWDDIKSKIMNVINQTNLYNYMYQRLISLYDVPSELLPKLQQLDQIKDNYYAMLSESYNLIGERITFYLEPGDIDIVRSTTNGFTSLQFVSPQNDEDKHDFFIDFMITTLASHDRDIHSTYNKLYSSTGKSKTPLFLIPSKDPHDEFNSAASRNINKYDWFDAYTSDFFNIGYQLHRNIFKYVFKFHRQIKLMNVMSDLECEVAASFATQSNHNMIGRTIERFTPIKYYKINDDDDMFWVAFYDRDAMNIPVAFNANVIFTMDVVLLQNRKLLYS